MNLPHALRGAEVLARPATIVMLSVPPRASARSSSVRHSCSDDSMVLIRSSISAFETCFVRPSLQSKTSRVGPRRSWRLTTGVAAEPPIALDKI